MLDFATEIIPLALQELDEIYFDLVQYVARWIS
jgi:hypothetical protein